MKAAVLFSGGKDSVFAAFVCQSMGWEVELLTIQPAKYSTMFHHPNVKWCRRQAREMDLKILMVKAKGKTEEDELAAMKDALKRMKVGAVASGAIESEYQKERVDRVAHELGIRSFSPIWRTGARLLEEQCRYFDTYVVAVAAEGLSEGMLGRKFDSAFVEYLGKLNPAVNPHLEGGEGETFVANAPFFKKRLDIKKWKKSFCGSSGEAEISSLG
ncbi:TPA: diphthine--ammonia ligase [Candidatus Micrarchaeota archaeon]|nr:diphthine--ammonia ligase [Candidatus Micrarchaeota archaeon]